MDRNDTTPTDPDPVLASLLGPLYPINRPLTQSVQDYVDQKLQNMNKAMEHYRQSTSTRMKDEINQAKAQIKVLKDEVLEIKKSIIIPTTTTIQQQPPPPPTVIPVIVEDVSPPTPTLTSTPTKPSPLVLPTKDNNVSLSLPGTPHTHGATATTTTSQIIYQAVGNIPPPKFFPHVETAENFLLELDSYMRRKRLAPEDWILLLPSVFSTDKTQSVWWQRTKLIAKTWDDFKQHFILMYGSDSDKLNSLEKLLNRRQHENEDFQTFAFEMDMQYRKVYLPAPSSNESEILQFISERSLPFMRVPLMGCGAKSLIDLINFANKIHPPPPPQQQIKPKHNNNSVRVASTKEEKKEDKTSSSSSPSTNKNNKKSNNINNRRTFTCEYCPHLTNHSTSRCTKNNKPNPPTAKAATTTEVKDSGNGKEE
jgi:hypothetical protein